MKIKFLGAQMVLLVSASWVAAVHAQDEFIPAPPQDVQQMQEQMPQQTPEQTQQMPVDDSEDEDRRPPVKTKVPVKPAAPVKKVIVDDGGSLKLVPSK